MRKRVRWQVTNNAAGRKRLLPGAIETGLKRLGRMAIGGSLVALAVIGWTSLVSWSIHDPSLNHATHETPRNLLGYLGAAAADMTFQSLGLAAVALFLPLAAWGWHLIADSQSTDKLRLRMLAWPVSSLLIAAGLAAFPAPARWPLPNGLGGIMGDLLLAVLQLVGTLLPTVVVAIIGAAGFLAAGLLSLLFACGIPLTAAGAARDVRAPRGIERHRGHDLGRAHPLHFERARRDVAAAAHQDRGGGWAPTSRTWTTSRRWARTSPAFRASSRGRAQSTRVGASSRFSAIRSALSMPNRPGRAHRRRTASATPSPGPPTRKPRPGGASSPARRRRRCRPNTRCRRSG